MIRTTLTFLTCLIFAGCMTEADKAQWLEAKETFSGTKHESVADKAAVPPEAPAADLKTSQDVSDKAKDEESLAPPKESDGPILKEHRAD